MNRHTASSSTLTILIGCTIGFAVSDAGAKDVPETRDLGDLVGKVREQFRAPAVAAAVTRNGQLVAIGVSGVRGLEGQEAVSKTDRSMIGSRGKSATRLLIGRLVEKGKLRWDSTLAELLPDVEMREAYASVTIGDIIAHRGGLPAYTRVSPNDTPILFEQNGPPREQRAAFAAHLLAEAPAAPPKTRFAYSNAGYGLLGHIAERIADTSFEQLMRDEVFRPLGMSSAIVGLPGESQTVPGWIGHERTPKGFEQVKRARTGLPAIAPAGMMSLSIEDFAKLGAALVDVETGKPTEFLGRAAIEKLPELRPGSKGTEGEVFLGGDGQYTAALALWPGRGLCIVVESNAGDSDDLCEALVNAVRAEVAPEIPSRESHAGGTPKQKRYGFQILAEGDDNNWLVGLVEAESPAATAGLKQGDRIVLINGSPLEDLSANERSDRLRQPLLNLKVERDGKPVDISMRLP